MFKAGLDVVHIRGGDQPTAPDLYGWDGAVLATPPDRGARNGAA